MELEGQYHAPAALRPGNNRGKDPVRGNMGPGAGMKILKSDIPTPTGFETRTVQSDH
jgi:hypothetical protein